LRKLFRTLLALLIVATAATAIKAVFFNFKIRKPGDPPPCWSSDEAKREGVWICDVSVEPNSFQSDGKTYRLGEAWIEEAFDDAYFLVWFPQRTKLGWNRLCLRVPRYEHGAIELDKFGTTYPGSDFQYVIKLDAGEFPTVDCRVQFRQWEPDKKSDLGRTMLKSVLGRTDGARLRTDRSRPGK
jgi:hypothetical protein